VINLNSEIPTAGNIIFLNGTSSSGKSTLSKVLQSSLSEPFWHFSSDHFIDADMHPRKQFEDGSFDWKQHRPKFFDAFHRSIPAFANAGNHLIVEHIVESVDWAHQLAELLDGIDVFVVSVTCPLTELKRREKARGNRREGEAEYHLSTYGFAPFDIEVDLTENTQTVITQIMRAWCDREQPCRFTERWRSVEAI